MSKILITSALPYVNNIPHLGNILCVVSGDAISRYYKEFTDNEVLYICGADEYGTSTELKALEEGLECQEICNKYFEIHSSIYKWFNIDFSYFGRTTDKVHAPLAQEIFKKLYDNNFLIEKEVDQLYSEDLNMFIGDRWVIGICPKCKDISNAEQCDCGHLQDITKLIDPKYKFNHNFKLEFRKSKHLFLDLPKLGEKLEEFVNEYSAGWRPNAKAVTRAWLSKGLKPRCITRDNKWGTSIVGIPGYENKTMYCWFDAPIGYISITKALLGDEYKEWYLNQDTTLIQTFSKDNIPFHTIMFPATLLALQTCSDNYILPKKIASTEYITCNGTKFSKSNKNGVFGDTIIDISKKLEINEDYWRYYLFKTRPEVSDTSFTWEIFVNVINSDLINCIGNLVNRVYSMSAAYRNNTIIMDTFDMEQDIKEIQIKMDNYHKSFDKLKLKNAINDVLDMAIYANAYLNKHSPWTKYRQDNDDITISNVLGFAINVIQYIALYLKPFIPNSSTHISSHVLEYDICNKKVFNINKNIKLSSEKFILPFKKILTKDFI